MCVTFEDVWNMELEYSPGIAQGTAKQIIKATEELGEVASAYLKGDVLEMKLEIADSLNTLFGLAIHCYESPDELSTGIMNAIEKMADKYVDEI